MRVSLRLLLSGDENLLVGIVQDGTDKKLLKDQLYQQLQLTESLAGSVLDRVIITDAGNTILLWNGQCERVYKIKADDAVGKNFFDVFPQLKTEEELRLFNKVLKGETVHLSTLQSVLGNRSSRHYSYCA
jgi:PAS domain-containing protein